MNIRFSSLLWIVGLATAAFVLYLVKYEVKEVKTAALAVERQLNHEREMLHMLRAEWAYLNRPERLRDLAGKYLQMREVSGEQLVALNLLPEADQAATLAATTQGSPMLHPAQIVVGRAAQYAP